MKILLTLAVFSIVTFFYVKDSIVNTVWTYKVAKNANDTLRFKAHNIVIEYDCELNYTMKGTYKFSKDTLIVTMNDDSHSEDGGKPEIFRTKYFLKKNNTFLSVLTIQRLIRNNWEQVKADAEYTGYKRIR